MSLEFWLPLAAAGLLVVSATAHGLAWFGVAPGWRLWTRAILGLRVATVAVLVGALTLGLASHKTGMPLAALRIAEAVALAAVILHLGLWAWYRFDGAGPAADLVAVALVAAGLGASWPAGLVLGCAQCAVPAQIQTALFLAGAGATAVMGGTGIVLPIRALAVRQSHDRRLPGRAELSNFMQGATVLALVLLASGLVVGAWWTWRTLGTLTGDDLRWGWMAAAWLFALIGWLAWRLARHNGPVAITFALLAAAVANVGVLAAEPLQHWLGF